MPGRRFLTGWTVPPIGRDTPFQAEADASSSGGWSRRPVPRRQIYHGYTDCLTIAAKENAIPQDQFAAMAGRPDDSPQPGPLDGADRSGRADSHHQDPPAAVLLPGRTAHPLGTPVDPASSGAGLGLRSSAAPWPGCEPFHSRPDGTVATDPPTGQPKIEPGPREFPAAYSLAIPRIAAPADGHRGPCAAMKTVRRPPYPKWNPGYFPCSSLTPLPLSSRRPSVSFGGFGFR